MMGIALPPTWQLNSLQIECKEFFMPNRQIPSKPAVYEIQVSGRIDPERVEWFGGLILAVKDSEGSTVTTVLSGEIPDQAALFGILNRIRDLGMRLISVNRKDPDSP
jgi:hypothetical protein